MLVFIGLSPDKNNPVQLGLTKFDFKINETKRKKLSVRKISVESKSFVERVFVLNDIIESNRTSF